MPGNSCATNACNDRREQHEVVLPLPSLGTRIEARQRARRLHDGELAVAAEGVLALELHDEVEALVQDARERVRGIEAERRQHRHDFLVEMILQPARLLGRSSCRGCEQADAVRLPAPGSSTSLRQRVLLVRPAASRARESRSSCSGSDKASGPLPPRRAPAAASGPRRGSRRTRRGWCRNAQEAQRARAAAARSPCLLEHPPVELEQRELAVDVELRGLEIRGIHRRGLL